MKHFLRTLSILLTVLVLVTGLFSCDKEREPDASTDLNALSLEVTSAAIPEGDTNAEIAEKLLSALTEAGFEKAEIVASLRALKEKANGITDVLIGLYDGAFSKESIKTVYVALGAIANAVSPERAGELYYSVASSISTDLPYSQADCRKVASLLFALNADLDDSFVSGIFNDGLSSVGTKELNTLFQSLSASLIQTKTISDGAKAFLYEQLTQVIDEYEIPSDFTPEQVENMLAVKQYFKDLAKVILDHFEAAISYASAFFESASARLVHGGSYVKTDEVLYYGYVYETWNATQITKEEYEARAGEYDDYFMLEGTALGYYNGDRFVKIPNKDVELGEKVYTLQVLYRAYQKLSTSEKNAFDLFADACCTVLSRDEASLSALLNLPAHDPVQGAETATWSELLTALSTLSSFNSLDGVTVNESQTAFAAIAVCESYLRYYFPHLF